MVQTLTVEELTQKYGELNFVGEVDVNGLDVNDFVNAIEEKIRARDKSEAKTTEPTEVQRFNTAPGTTPSPSGQIEAFKDLERQGKILKPPYNPKWLAKIGEKSSILPQCVDALAKNIEGFGFDFEPGFDVEKVDADTQAGYEDERERLRQWFENSTADYSFGELRDRTRRDIEYIGWGAWEFMYSMAGEFVGFEHLPARGLRLGRLSKELVAVDRFYPLADGSGWEVRQSLKRVRLLVQVADDGTKAWFKMPGDPRAVVRRTGKIEKARMEPADYAKLDPKDNGPLYARPALFFGRYNPSGPYPLPRWIGALIGLAGSRAAEEVNWEYLTNKSVPPMLLLISGGNLTDTSRDHITEKFEEVKGIDNFHKFAIVEAKGARSGTGGQALLDPNRAQAPTIEVVKLSDLQHGDALFQVFDKNSRDKVRSSVGLPPIFTGETMDYTRATAAVSLEVAEQNVFRPERVMMDDRINRFVMPLINAMWWRFKSKGPRIVNVEELSKLLEIGIKGGALTPNHLLERLGESLGIDLPQIEEAWGNLPFEVFKMLLQAGKLKPEIDEGGVMTFEVDDSEPEPPANAFPPGQPGQPGQAPPDGVPPEAGKAVVPPEEDPEATEKRFVEAARRYTGEMVEVILGHILDDPRIQGMTGQGAEAA